MSLQKTFLKNNFLVLAGQILVLAKGIILMPIIIRACGVHTYGAYALLITYVGLVFGISSLGIGFRFQRFMPSAAGVPDRQRLFYVQFWFQSSVIVILSLLVWVGGDWLARTFLKEGTGFPVLGAISLMWATFVFSQSTDFYRYTHRMSHFTVATTINPYLAIGILVAGLAVYHGVSLDFLLLSGSAAMMIVSLPLVIGILREIGIGFPRVNAGEIRADILLGFPIILSLVADFMISGSDRFVIAYYMSAREVGFYNPAYTLGSLLIVFPKVFGVVLPPLLSKAVDQQQESTATDLVNNAVRMFLFLGVPFVVAVTVVSPPVLLLLAGQEVAMHAQWVTPLISVGIIFYGLTVILAHGVAFVKLKTDLIFYSNVIAGLMSIALNLAVMYFIRSIMVAACVSLVSFTSSFLFLHHRTRTLFPVRYDRGFLGKLFVAAVPMTLVAFLISSSLRNTLIGALVGAAAGGVIYLGGVWALKGFSQKEIRFARDLVNTLVRRA